MDTGHCSLCPGGVHSGTRQFPSSTGARKRCVCRLGSCSTCCRSVVLLNYAETQVREELLDLAPIRFSRRMSKILACTSKVRLVCTILLGVLATLHCRRSRSMDRMWIRTACGLRSGKWLGMSRSWVADRHSRLSLSSSSHDQSRLPDSPPTVLFMFSGTRLYNSRAMPACDRSNLAAIAPTVSSA